MSLAFSLLLGLLSLCLVGGTYALAVSGIARRYGPRGLWASWALLSIALGSIGALRNLGIQRSRGIDPARVSVTGLYALLIVTALVIFSVPTAMLWRRGAARASARPSRIVLAGIGWTLMGLLFAVVIAAILDFHNVRFVPFHQPS